LIITIDQYLHATRESKMLDIGRCFVHDRPLITSSPTRDYTKNRKTKLY